MKKIVVQLWLLTVASMCTTLLAIDAAGLQKIINTHVDAIKKVGSTYELLKGFPEIGTVDYDFYYRKNDRVIVAALSKKGDIAFYLNTDGTNSIILVKGSPAIAGGVGPAVVNEIGIGYPLLINIVDFMTFDPAVPDRYSNVISYLNVAYMIGYVVPTLDTVFKKTTFTKTIDSKPNPFDVNPSMSAFAVRPIKPNITRKVKRANGTELESSGYVITTQPLGQTLALISDSPGKLDRLYCANKLDILRGGSWRDPNTKAGTTLCSYSNTADFIPKLWRSGSTSAVSDVHCYFVDTHLPYERKNFFTFVRPMDGYVMQFALINDTVFFCGHLEKNAYGFLNYPLKDTYNGYVYKQLNSTMVDGTGKLIAPTQQTMTFVSDIPMVSYFTQDQINQYARGLLALNSFADTPSSLATDTGYGVYTVRRYVVTSKPKDAKDRYNPYKVDAVGYRVADFRDIGISAKVVGGKVDAASDCCIYALHTSAGAKPDDIILATKFHTASGQNWWINALWSNQNNYAQPLFTANVNSKYGTSVAKVNDSTLLIGINAPSISASVTLRYLGNGIEVNKETIVRTTSAQSLSFDAVNARRSNYVLKNSYETPDGVFIGF